MLKKKRGKAFRERNLIERNWDEWGKALGKRLEERGRIVLEEAREVGKKKLRNSNAFVLTWPLFAGLVATFFLAAGIWFLGFVNSFVGNGFLALLIDFGASNIHLFFAAFFLIGLSEAVSNRFPKSRKALIPFTSSAATVFSLWIASSIIGIYGKTSGSLFLVQASDLIRMHLLFLFIVVFFIVFLSMHFFPKKRSK